MKNTVYKIMRQKMLQRKTMGGSFLSTVRAIVVFCFAVAVQAFVVIHGILIFYGVAVQELGVSAHIPHPDDNPEYWNVFLEKVDQFENNSLINDEMMDQLRNEINKTMSDFNMEKVIEYALA